MNSIEFVSAGAGSGKTYRLTNLLADALVGGLARAEGVLAMTFTLKAAAELRQRSRGVLLDRGRLDLATHVGNARIGTVNAVCGQLLQRHCFELGVSPHQTVLSDEQTSRMLRHALEEVLDTQARHSLITLGERLDLDPDEWDAPVEAVVHAARSNLVPPAELPAMAHANADAMLSNWPTPAKERDALTETLTAAIERAVVDVGGVIEQRRAAGAVVSARSLDGQSELREHHENFVKRRWKWKHWVALSKIEGGVPLRTALAPVIEAARHYSRHPRFAADIRTYIGLIFDLAQQVLVSYEKAKVASGAQDFTDQEALFLRAIQENASVRKILADELDLVLVDEFQDTSPIQLAIFVELAKLAKRSVWVGDPKQAIYGFRGTDAALIAAVIEAIPGWGGHFGEPLTTSRRSVASLVQVVNDTFTAAFAPRPASEVRLSSSRADHPTQAPIAVWAIGSKNIEQDFAALGPAIADLLQSGRQVWDREAGWREIKPSDIAVLCRTNSQLGLVSAALAKWGIPCASARSGLLSTPEACLVLACLRRMHDRQDSIATAQILALARGDAPEEWLAGRIDHMRAGTATSDWGASGDQACALIQRLDALSEQLRVLTPQEALSLARAESTVILASAGWSASQQEATARIANATSLVHMSRTYEDECRSGRRPASVSGLLDWLDIQRGKGADLRAAASFDAVQALTRHSAKGLEWPVVILTGLDSQAKSGLWDVRAKTSGVFDANAPLNNRFIHFWPRPYGERRVTPETDAARLSSEGQAMEFLAIEEHKRLLYVACTRARDLMIGVIHGRKNQTAWFAGCAAPATMFSGTGDVVLTDGSAVGRIFTEFTEAQIIAEPLRPERTARRGYQEAALRALAPLWVRPSDAPTGEHVLLQTELVGNRMPVDSSSDMTLVGSALHAALAVGLSDPTTDVDDIAAILARWGVDGWIGAQSVDAQINALKQWLNGRWPNCPVLAEVPLEVGTATDQIVRGQVDALVETPDGWILLDHKSDPRGGGSDHRLAQEHGAQLEIYAAAIQRATGRPVLEQWLFLPIAAQAARIEKIR